MYEDKPEFPGGRGVQNKKTSMGGVWIFSVTARLAYIAIASSPQVQEAQDKQNQEKTPLPLVFAHLTPQTFLPSHDLRSWKGISAKLRLPCNASKQPRLGSEPTHS